MTLEKARTRDRGFTAIELLVVLAVLAVLIAILLPAVAGVRNRAEDTAAAGALRQTYVALQLYSFEHNLGLPYWNTPGDPDGPYELYGRNVYHFPGSGHFERMSWTWANMIVPYMSGTSDIGPRPFRLVSHPDDETLFLCRFKMTYGAFADPWFWSDDRPATDSMLRGTRMTEVKWPARKALLIDGATNHRLNGGVMVQCAAADGSIGSHPPRSESGVVDRLHYGAAIAPLFATRYGLRGIDF
ncbi:MAG: prepilin-type N-terminal cleavage/methylation domain-containing protein [Phycisphaerales bacterium]